MDTLLRKIPKVDEILKHEQWLRLLQTHPQDVAKDALRGVLDELRLAIKAGRTASLPSVERIIEETDRRAAELSRPKLRKVINGTGVVIHTNLGRSPLAKSAIDALVSVASSYSNLEYDVKQGKEAIGTSTAPPPCRNSPEPRRHSS